ncbi:hypothetical protein BGZ95_005383 [Linnemannia exigua]|uniref:Uncharacterized protein n=1 Tax=Linnemannia exigua TaxID=604196 RepID=A0AAD4DGT0_9FUNG|nr:hypothetical protein BGZ95_005383 [Linnemannia exigua]
MPLAPLRLAVDPSRSPAWSPCHSVDTLLSPAPTAYTYTTTDPSNYKLASYNNNNNSSSNNPFSHANANANAHQCPQNKLSPRLVHPQLPHPQQQQQQQQQMTSQLDYYRQLQIMHCQRERDIGRLYRQHQHFQQQHQHQQQQQQDRPPSHAIQRGLLAQRMLHLQRLFQAQQIQKIQAMHKLGRAEAPPAPSPLSPTSPSPPPSLSNTNIMGIASESGAQQQPFSFSSESRAERGPSDPNTIHLARSSPLAKMAGVPELAKIVLPSPDQIRRQRQQRLKYHARLRQAAAKANAISLSTAPATATTTTQQQQQQQQTAVQSSSMPVSPPASPSPYYLPSGFTPTPHSPSSFASSGPPLKTTATVTAALPLSPVTPTVTATPKELSVFPSSLSVPLLPLAVPQVQPAVWTSSTTSLVPRSKADLQYRRQLRLRLAIQQHLIQDHTQRYRLFQAFCLLQRAQAAQAMEEAQTHRQRQLHTVAWVQALRHSQSTSQLDIPQ